MRQRFQNGPRPMAAHKRAPVDPGDFYILAHIANVMTGYTSETKFMVSIHKIGYGGWSDYVIDDPSYGDSGTLTLTVSKNGSAAATYCGISLATSMPAAFGTYAWYPYIVIRQYGTWAGTPAESLDNFSCDGFSDDFDRSAGTLYSDSGTDWVEIQPGLDIMSNALVQPDSGGPAYNGSSMYWDDTTTSDDVAISVDVTYLTALGFNDAYRIWIGLYNYLAW